MAYSQDYKTNLKIQTQNYLSKHVPKSLPEHFILPLALSLSFITLGLITLYQHFHTYKETLNKQWLNIFRSSSLVGTDYTSITFSEALLNAGILGIFSMIITYLISPNRKGYEISAMFLWIGGGLSGKNLINVWPNIVGVCIYYLLKKKHLKELYGPMMFGTTLSPIVSYLISYHNFTFTGIVFGTFLGILVGFLLSALVDHIYTLHLGMNMYNIGTAGGFLGIIIATTLSSFGYKFIPNLNYNENNNVSNLLLILLFFYFSFVLIFALYKGFSISTYKQILACCGRLPSDFTQIGNSGSTYFNIGLLGFLGTIYVIFVGGKFNGPVVTSILALAGFAGVGKHIKNCTPIILGVWFMCYINKWDVSDPKTIISALSATTLAPFCGKFGYIAGFISGMLHLPITMHIAPIHGYLNLYNSGFAGGIVMTIFVGLLKGLFPREFESLASYHFPQSSSNACKPNVNNVEYKCPFSANCKFNYKINFSTLNTTN